NKSKRKARRFVAVNCAAIPESLLESELFGHEKGAFTGAVARRIGKFEEADGGTLLLDEITEMELRLQAKLLSAIQEREIDRVGSNKPVQINVRIIATSNRNMEQAVRDGQFREDLYFRLNVMNLRLPPLAERPADVLPLAKHFIDKFAESNDVLPKPLTDDAIEKLAAYGWPGNVRELENTMHRAVLLAAGPNIDAAAIFLTSSDGGGAAQRDSGGEGGNLVGRTVADVERELIIETLDHCLGNRTHAANILGISIRTLRNKLKLYGDEGFRIPNPGGDAPRAGA
ncbi:MAG: sigma-54 dependent transcriptional regulator, partial [Proteobacteria bacterium]|nr:sigma-54 dependent transcriptional regulator [Pseudomonadota bacterium]